MPPVWRWTCPRCGLRTPWRTSEEALRVERVEHCTDRHPNDQFTARDLSATFWNTD